jgi:hypothetical protein
MLPSTDAGLSLSRFCTQPSLGFWQVLLNPFSIFFDSLVDITELILIFLELTKNRFEFRDVGVIVQDKTVLEIPVSEKTTQMYELSQSMFYDLLWLQSFKVLDHQVQYYFRSFRVVTHSFMNRIHYGF